MAIEIDPHLAKAHSSLGALLQSIGNTDEALAEYFRAIEIEPNNVEVSLNIAAIQLAQSQPDQALSRLDHVIELTPENGEAHQLRGRTHLTLRHFPQAVEDFQLALKRLQNRPDVCYQLALALEATHKTAEALEAAEQAVRLAPDFADARTLSQRLALANAAAVKAKTALKPDAATRPSSPGQ